MMFTLITIIVFILMLTVVPATCLTIIPGLVNVRKHRIVTCMSFSDLKTSILSAVVVPILVLSSSTVSPSFAETVASVASKDIVAITSLDKGKQSTVSKEASDRSSLENLSDRVGKNENDIKDLRNDLRVLIVLIIVGSTLLLIRSEVNNNEMKKEMKMNRAEMKEEMKIIKAESDAKMDRNFIITTGLSAGALLVSIVMTLATKK